MKKPWERAPLDEAVFLQEGPGIRSYEYQKGGYPMINVRCVQDGYIDLSTCNAANVELATGKWKHFQVQEGDILFTISGSIGRTAVVKKKDLPLLMNTSVVRFRSKTTRLRDDFFFYYLQSEDFLGKLHALSSGTAQKNVGPTHLKTLDVPLPPLAEQQRIVGLLDEAFEGLATAKANAEKNLQNARALFESHLQSVFTQRGEGWQTKTLFETCDVVNGGTPKTGVPEYWDGKHRWITPAEMGKRLNPYVSETERMISDLGLRNSSAQMLPPHSVILSSRAPIGYLVINTEPMATNQGCKGLIPGGHLHHKFLYYYLSSIVDLLNSLGTGATFKELSGGKLKEVPVVVAPLLEQQQIVAKLDDLREETQRLARLYERKHALLTALKKSLLHQAFTGEL